MISVLCYQHKPLPRQKFFDPAPPAESLGHLLVPFKLTVCGLPGSLSPMTSVADRAPAALGLNARLIVQLPSRAAGCSVHRQGEFKVVRECRGRGR